jgi:steroid 5-alpha-reductase/3-oxo-5-alpha-steroid 4-dehydrogenase 1
MAVDRSWATIRGLEGVFRLLLDDTYYEVFCIANMVLAVCLLFYFLRHPLRLGRLYRPGTSRLSYELNATWSVFLVNASIVFTFQYVSGFFAGFDHGCFAAWFFLWLHIFRAVALAAFRSAHATPWPLESLLYAAASGALRATLAARAIAGLSDFYGFAPLSMLILNPLILILAAVQGWLDYRVARLREPGERGYKVPTAFPFTYVSGPSYLLEVVIWLLWGFTLPLDFGTIAIWLWLLPNVYARAEATHRWYHKIFKGRYPRARTAIVPFVSVSTLFTGVLSTLQYLD